MTFLDEIVAESDQRAEVLKPKDSVNVAAMLGMNSSHTVMLQTYFFF